MQSVPDGNFHALTGAGLFGLATSTSMMLPRLMSLTYMGHVLRDDRPLRMQDFVPEAPDAKLSAPVILLVGTSMSAGKTTTGRMIIHELKKSGLRIVGAKFTGAARYRDVLTYKDAGADAVLDFVDAGLPSTVVPRRQFHDAMRYLMRRVAALEPDILVAEAGASPLEPYNGDVAIDQLQKQVKADHAVRIRSLRGTRRANRFRPETRPGHRPRHQYHRRHRAGREALRDPGAEPDEPGLTQPASPGAARRFRGHSGRLKLQNGCSVLVSQPEPANSQ